MLVRTLEFFSKGFDMTRLFITIAVIFSIAGMLSACSAAPTATPTEIPSPTTAPTQTAIPSATFTPIPTALMEPTITLAPVSRVNWPTTTDEGNQVIQKILSALSAAGMQTADVVTYTDATDTNTLLGRPHQYIAKAAWRDPSIASQGEPGVDTGGSIEVFLTPPDLKARYTYVDAITSSSPLFAEYHYQNAPAFLRLSKNYLPSQAKKIADVFLSLIFNKV
jgi:hypothetical protein